MSDKTETGCWLVDLWQRSKTTSSSAANTDELRSRTWEMSEIFKTVAEEMAAKAGEYYNLDCPMAGSGMIGRNWAETH